MGGLKGVGRITGWAYKRNKRNVSERRDKTYLRNELKLTYHNIWSYIVRHNKWRTYSKTSIKHLCDWIGTEWKSSKKTTRVNVINLPVCRETVISVAWTFVSFFGIIIIVLCSKVTFLSAYTFRLKILMFKKKRKRNALIQ